MSMWRNQRGEVPVGCLVGLVVLLIAALVAIKVTPVMLNVGELEKTVRELADRANRMDYNDKRIAKEILTQAGDLDIPLDPANLKIKRSRARIIVTAEFTKPIEFPGYTYQWHKVIKEDRPLF